MNRVISRKKMTLANKCDNFTLSKSFTDIEKVKPRLKKIIRDYKRKKRKFLPLQARVFLKAHDQHIDTRYPLQLPDQALESCGREPEQQGPEHAQAHMGRALKDDEDMTRVNDKTSRCCVNVERVFRFKGERIWEE